jgi:mono/diheme cytochrome c family protein
MRPVILSICLAMTLTACADAGRSAPALATADPLVQRGLAIAQRRCASCHDIGVGKPPAITAAPPFRTVRLRYNSLSLQRRLSVIGEEGHYDMPRLSLQPTEIEDLARYLESAP